MLRSAATPNRTECNRVRHETRTQPETISPTRAASAARGVARIRRQKIIPNAFGVRLFKG